MGSVQEAKDGAHEVQDDYELIAFDMVSNPSTHGSFMSQLKESKQVVNERDKFKKINYIITDILLGMEK